MAKKAPKPARKAKAGGTAKPAASGAGGRKRAAKAATRKSKTDTAIIPAQVTPPREPQPPLLWPRQDRSDWPRPLPENWRRVSAPVHLAGAALLMAFGLDGDHAVQVSADAPHWSEAQVLELQRLIDKAPEDGLPRLDITPLEAALARGREGRIAASATALATQLARMHLLGAAGSAERRDWHIPDTDAKRPLAEELAAALGENRLEAFVTELGPTHPSYIALREALAAEPDPARRERIARNMERWRWLPRSLGKDYVLANAAGFEVALWRGGSERQRWAAISGRAKTPTPAVTAMATAVNFNPWWEVPESIAKTTRMSPRLGFIQAGKRYRQRPGPNNSLGQMKLVMYNPHNIYLHDTPSRGLFGARERAFSHGCIRVADALGFARTMLGGRLNQEAVDKIIEEKEPKLVYLPQQMPVYVTYFTVDLGKNGELRFHKDIYGHDAAIRSVAVAQHPQFAAR